MNMADNNDKSHVTDSLFIHEDEYSVHEDEYSVPAKRRRLENDPETTEDSLSFAFSSDKRNCNINYKYSNAADCMLKHKNDCIHEIETNSSISNRIIDADDDRIDTAVDEELIGIDDDNVIGIDDDYQDDDEDDTMDMVHKYIDKLVKHAKYDDGLSHKTIKSTENIKLFSVAINKSKSRKRKLELKQMRLKKQLELSEKKLSCELSYRFKIYNILWIAKGLPRFYINKEKVLKFKAVCQSILGRELKIFEIPDVTVVAQVWNHGNDDTSKPKNQEFGKTKHKYDKEYITQLQEHCCEKYCLSAAELFDQNNEIEFKHNGDWDDCSEAIIKGRIFILCDLNELTRKAESCIEIQCKDDEKTVHTRDRILSGWPQRSCLCSNYDKWALIWLTHDWILKRRKNFINDNGDIVKSSSN